MSDKIISFEEKAAEKADKASATTLSREELIASERSRFAMLILTSHLEQIQRLEKGVPVNWSKISVFDFVHFLVEFRADLRANPRLSPIEYMHDHLDVNDMTQDMQDIILNSLIAMKRGKS